MKEGLKLKYKVNKIVEKYLPECIPIVLFIFLVFSSKDNIIYYKNFIEAVSSCITIIAIFIGLYGSVIPIIHGMKNKNSIVETVLDSKPYNRYLMRCIKSSFFSLILSFFMYFIEDISSIENIRRIVSNLWIASFVYFLLSNIRYIYIIYLIIFETDSEQKKRS